jgi:hypothetical protein
MTKIIDTLVLRDFPEHKVKGYWYHDIKAYLTRDRFEEFAHFMFGQTLAVLPDSTGENKVLVYAGDWDRWVRGLPVID